MSRPNQRVCNGSSRSAVKRGQPIKLGNRYRIAQDGCNLPAAGNVCSLPLSWSLALLFTSHEDLSLRLGKANHKHAASSHIKNNRLRRPTFGPLQVAQIATELMCFGRRELIIPNEIAQTAEPLFGTVVVQKNHVRKFHLVSPPQSILRMGEQYAVTSDNTTTVCRIAQEASDVAG